MLELVIDTASGALSVALIDGPALVAEHHEEIGRGHAETVVAVIAAVVGAHRGAVGGIVVGVGPGSFTGARIGIAAARALGLAWGVPVVGVGSLALVAAGAFAAGTGDTVVVVADAGRGRVYWQAFARGGRAVAEPAAGAAADVVVPPGAVKADALPRAADARFLVTAARGPAVPLYLGAAA